MSDESPFPWPLASAAALPRMSDAGPDDHRRDAAILEWFALRRGGEPRAKGALRRWIENLRGVAKGEALRDVPRAEAIIGGETRSASNLASLVDYYASRQVAHSIRVVESAALAGAVRNLTVDPDFILGELHRPDYSGRDRPALPAGGGTLLLAGQCARLGAETLIIHGSGSEGVDVEWTTSDGHRVWFECKARAFGSAFAPGTTTDDFHEYVRREVADAADGLARAQVRRGDDGPARVVHLSAFVPHAIADQLHHADWKGLLERRLSARGTEPQRLPHFVVFHWLGLDLTSVDTRAASLRNFIRVPAAAPPASSATYEVLERLSESPARPVSA